MHLTVYYIKVLANEAKLFYGSLFGAFLGGIIVLHALKWQDLNFKKVVRAS
jgi:predicted alpha/beta superfamily hydrolase